LSTGQAVPPSGEGAEGEWIKLDQFLKLAQIAQTGGHAKVLIREGLVRVNGEVETRRGRKLRDGDRVEVEGELLVVGVE
jgi:ribosome-associated protein